MFYELYEGGNFTLKNAVNKAISLVNGYPSMTSLPFLLPYFPATTAPPQSISLFQVFLLRLHVYCMRQRLSAFLRIANSQVSEHTRQGSLIRPESASVSHSCEVGNTGAIGRRTGRVVGEAGRGVTGETGVARERGERGQGGVEEVRNSLVQSVEKAVLNRVQRIGNGLIQGFSGPASPCSSSVAFLSSEAISVEKLLFLQN